MSTILNFVESRTLNESPWCSNMIVVWYKDQTWHSRYSLHEVSSTVWSGIFVKVVLDLSTPFSFNKATGKTRHIIRFPSATIASSHDFCRPTSFVVDSFTYFDNATSRKICVRPAHSTATWGMPSSNLHVFVRLFSKFVSGEMTESTRLL